MFYDGIIIGIITFLCIGIFHPIVIKAEYYFTKKVWPIFLIAGISTIILSIFVDNYIARCSLAVLGISCLWSILELFEQEKRVQRGWFPDGRKRKTQENKEFIE
ncbi:MAG: DUF4491 family protein [Acholeplasmatales bacterium]|nr:DUF4491 family protein [Acholeplasmatales bacterium]